jgi:hypothetical protein
MKLVFLSIHNYIYLLLPLCVSIYCRWEFSSPQQALLQLQQSPQLLERIAALTPQGPLPLRQPDTDDLNTDPRSYSDVEAENVLKQIWPMVGSYRVASGSTSNTKENNTTGNKTAASEVEADTETVYYLYDEVGCR